MARTVYRLFIPSLSLLLFVSMSLLSCSYSEKTETAYADVNAAHMQGRNTARDIINRQWNDTIELMQAMKKARAGKIRYDSTGHPECVAAFDSAFIGTIRAVRPNLERLVNQ